ncbi:MAG: DUF2178 domain-containing protein [Firmicutes bacterium]|nr:DUF2178 domain-containing protein [Bacillota bacterium]
MAQANWLLFAFSIGIFIIMFISISYMFYSLTKQGDERKTLIKTKAMSGTLVAIIAILIIQIVVSIITNHQLEGLNPLIFLTIISVVFFFLLIFNKKKYGG